MELESWLPWALAPLSQEREPRKGLALAPGSPRLSLSSNPEETGVSRRARRPGARTSLGARRAGRAPRAGPSLRPTPRHAPAAVHPRRAWPGIPGKGGQGAGCPWAGRGGDSGGGGRRGRRRMRALRVRALSAGPGGRPHLRSPRLNTRLPKHPGPGSATPVPSPSFCPLTRGSWDP